MPDCMEIIASPRGSRLRATSFVLSEHNDLVRASVNYAQRQYCSERVDNHFAVASDEIAGYGKIGERRIAETHFPGCVAIHFGDRFAQRRASEYVTTMRPTRDGLRIDEVAVALRRVGVDAELLTWTQSLVPEIARRAGCIAIDSHRALASASRLPKRHRAAPGTLCQVPWCANPPR